MPLILSERKCTQNLLSTCANQRSFLRSKSCNFSKIIAWNTNISIPNFLWISLNLHLFSGLNEDFLNHCQKVMTRIIFMSKIDNKNFKIERKLERKLERRSFFTKCERMTFTKLSASADNFSERTKAFIKTFRNYFSNR